VSDPGVLAAILRDDIVPLLEEYCFEDLSRLEEVLGEVVVDVEAQRVRYEVFDGEPEAAIGALLAAVPELVPEPPDSPEESETISHADVGDSDSADDPEG
jgi:5-methylcytosine-specific restriction enzyme B